MTEISDTVVTLHAALDSGQPFTRIDRVRRRMVDGKHDGGYYTHLEFERKPGVSYRVETEDKEGAITMRLCPKGVLWPQPSEDTAYTGEVGTTAAKTEPEATAPEGEGYPQDAVDMRGIRLLNCLLQAGAIERAYMKRTGTPISEVVQKMGVTLFLHELK